MKLNGLTLSFEGPWQDLEAHFREDYFHKSLKQVRIYLLLGAVFYGIFGILDAMLVPETKYALWVIRYGAVCPAILAVVLFSLSPRFKHYMQPSLAFAVTIAGMGIIVMIVIMPPPVSFTYYAGLILVFIVGYTFVRIRFVWATLSGWIIVAFYEIAAIWITETPFPVLLSNNFFFISANIIGMFACYSMEYYARRDFFLARLLKNEQDKVKTVNRQLEERVRERTEQLLKANQTLKLEIAAHQRAENEKRKLEDQLRQAQKMEAIGTLAGGIAHDFNNILAAIMGYTEMALFDVAESSSIFQKLNQVLKATQRARDLVNQILTFSRQNEHERKPIQINLLVKETLKLLRASLPATISIRQKIDSPEGSVLGDPTQIHQVLMNLCTNAAHAMRENGGELGVSLAEIELDAEGSEQVLGLTPGAYLHMEVSDTGCGMSKDTIDRIFEPFFTTKQPGEGTGMGLSVVHGIVKSHGGAIAVESEPGKGTKFHVYLPKIARETPERSEGPVAAEARGHESILFIDDEQALADIAKQMLEYVGYQVTTYTSSVDALDVFRRRSTDFDLVITDMTMPSLTGAALAKEMIRIRPGIPVILCTGYSETIDAGRAKEIGVKGFLMKPLTLHDLSHKIRQVLDAVEESKTSAMTKE